MKLVLDCDTGIDDALAIIHLANQPDVAILAAGSVHGNVGAPLAAENTLRVLELVGLASVPVAIGACRPLAQPLETGEFVHGQDGLGNINHPPPRSRPVAEAAAAQLVRLARQNPGELVILATGPLTNLALALLLDPGLTELVKNVVVMGGAIYRAGNATGDAEANVWHDPEAADLVFTAGWPLTLVGLDVTSTAVLAEADIAPLRDAQSPRARFAWAILQHYFDFYARYYGERACHLHDPLAAAIAVDPSLATYRETPVRVELRGQMTRGATRGNPLWDAAGPVGPAVSVATKVDLERFKRSFLESLQAGASAAS